MGLSDDQRAMLRLLAQRGEEGYGDVAALMGLSVEEVRAKVAEALAVLADEGALATTQEGDAAEPEPAAPDAPAPPPPPRPVAEAKPSTPRRSPSGPPKISLPSGQGARAAIAAAVLLLIALVVVLIVSGGGGGGSDSTTSAANDGEVVSEAQNTPTSNNAEVTKAALNPVDGSESSGVAIFGRVKNSLALQVVAKGLEPTTKGSTEYTVWLAQSPQRMLPLASTPVKADGRIAAQFEVPTEVLAYLANGTFDQLVITRTSDSALEAALGKATKEERTPDYTGTKVLSGTVVGPIVGAAKRIEEEKEAEKGE
jgi:hypothetical protein